MSDDGKAAVRFDEHIFSGVQTSADHNREEVDLALKDTELRLQALTEKIAKEVNSQLKSLSDVSELCSRINAIFTEIKMTVGYTAELVLIQGSVYHFLQALYSFSFMQSKFAEIERYYVVWKCNFIEFIEGVVSHYRFIVFRDIPLEMDIRVTREIFESENI